MPDRNKILSDAILDVIFRDSRLPKGWLDKDVSTVTIHALHDLLRSGPTEMNTSPARIVFIISTEGKRKLAACLKDMNAVTAPVIALVFGDQKFYDYLPKLFPYGDTKTIFTSKESFSELTMIKNASLQAAYLLMAARSLGLDCGPFLNFDKDLIKSAFISETSNWEPLFICGLGYGDPTQLHVRSPSLHFDEACAIL